MAGKLQVPYRTALNLALKAAFKAPVYLYRFALSPLLGPHCRHLPTCSQYALDAIDRNGIWPSLWLIAGRLARCHPWGTSGIDPAPSLTPLNIPAWQPWRYLKAAKTYRQSVNVPHSSKV
jgi:hypothetical protein